MPSQPALTAAEQQTFDLRHERYREDIKGSLGRVYGELDADFWTRLEAILRRNLGERPAELRRLDEQRLLRPDWLQDPKMMGYVAYTERFGGTLQGVAGKLDYLAELGITYLHLMPLLMPREGENDGGYAVADYRAVRPDLGNMDDLAALAAELHTRGMCLELDLVLNHVAREHEWAARARVGDPHFQRYFYMYPDRSVPDRYEQTLPEIFPDFAPGNFTHDAESGQWVWTTFNSYQWDLNWANPDVFLEFVDLILHLANKGVDIFRLDAIAFIWKRMGTDCQNQPEVHELTRALRACVRIAAPGVAFKAEAIVAPRDLMSYLGVRDHHGKVSDMAYHNALMVQLWSSLASRDIRLFEEALNAFAPKPSNTTWGMYLRCHDDIGWAISDEDAARAGLSGEAHRRFLSDFYSHEYPGSFARGVVFQANPRTGDRRISGSAASLAGLETEPELALQRLQMLQAITLGFGGVPLLYMGDELAMTNDYTFADTPEHAADNRWIHRPRMDWQAAEQRFDTATPPGQMFPAMRRLIAARAELPHLHASIESEVVRSPNKHVLLLQRRHPLGHFLGVYNFSEWPQTLNAWALRQVLGSKAREVLSGYTWNLDVEEVTLPPYAALWFVEEGE